MVCRTSDGLESGRFDFESDLWSRRRADDGSAASLRLVDIDDEPLLYTLLPYDAARVEPLIVMAPPSARQRRIAGARRRRHRVVENAVFAVTVAVALLASIAGGVHLLSPAAAANGAESAHVVVAPGDNLWTLAERYTPNGESTAQTVENIQAANPEIGDSRALRVGEQIVVPVGH